MLGKRWEGEKEKFKKECSLSKMLTDPCQPNQLLLILQSSVPIADFPVPILQPLSQIPGYFLCS